MKRKFIAFVITALIGFAHSIVPAYGDGSNTQPYNYNFKYSNGVSNLTAWVNYSSGAGIWIDYINGAINGWMYTGWDNPIYINVGSSNVGSNLDFHSHEDFAAIQLNAYTYTSYFLGNGTAVYPNGAMPYYYAEVHINDSYFLSDSFSNDSAYGEMRHAMGHALGLKDNNMNHYSIMCAYSMPREVNTVQLTDNNAIVSLYGY